MCRFMQKQYIPIIFAREHWATGIRVKVLRITLKFLWKKRRLWLRGMKVNWSIYNLSVTIISHDIRYKTMNIWPVYLNLKYRSAHTLCRTACLRTIMQNSRTHMCLKSSNFLLSSSKELEPLKSEHITQSYFFLLRTHTHTHTPEIKHCVYRSGK
jgi:hypothetical protein